jgi:uncharacterized membrane protein (UPF0182 family)
MLVLPINDTFLYMEPVYIQTAQARMPQLKKVVLAMGNTMVYRDTYEEALAALTGRHTAQPQAVTASAAAGTPGAAPPVAAAPAVSTDPRLEQMRGHMRRYKELSSQGQWSDAGRELEALERLLSRQQ